MKKVVSSLKAKRAVGTSKSGSHVQSALGGPSTPITKDDINRYQKKTTWNISKRFLASARDGSDLFLPLKAALVGVVALMDVVEACSFVLFLSLGVFHSLLPLSVLQGTGEAESSFQEIVQKVNGLESVFSKYTKEDLPTVIEDRHNGLISCAAST